MVIFSYTGSPQVKISQKVLGGGATFFDSHCSLIFFIDLYVVPSLFNSVLFRRIVAISFVCVCFLSM